MGFMRRVGLLVLSALAVFSPGAARAQASPPAHAAARSGLAAGLDAAAASDYAAAEKALLSVQGADRPAALLAVARIRFEQGRFADADRAAQQAAAGPDQRLAATALRGEILAAQGKVDDAIKLLTPSKDGAGTGGRRVRLVLGQLLIRAGRRADAEPILLKFADEYGSDAISSNDAEGLAMVGRAMHLLRHAKDANRAYNESERAERGASGETRRVETLLWRADLFFDTYDPGHAEESLLEALKIAPHRADANVLLARVKLEESFDFEAAGRLAGEALAVNPQHTGAYAVRAGIALRDMDLAAANGAIDAGLAIDPNDLQLLSMRAAARFLADDKPGFEAAKREVFARNKEYSQAYGIIGDYAEWEHRYDDVVAMMKEAVAARSEGQQGVGAARTHADARRRRGRGRQVPRGGVERRSLQRPRLQHARDALHALDPPAVRGRAGEHLQRPLSEGREGDPRALRTADARRGVGLDEDALHVRARRAGGRGDVPGSRALQRPHERSARTSASRACASVTWSRR